MNFIYSFWKVPDNPPEKADCFVVLSYAVRDKHNPTAPTCAAIDLSLKWQKKFPESYIILSTGDNQKLGVPNCRVMKEYAVKIGIPEGKIIEEDKSKTTVENLIFSRQIINRRKFKNITLIMYYLHTRRTLAVAGNLNWHNLNWLSAASPGQPAYGIKYFQTFSRFTILVYELLAYIYNRLRGEI